MKVESKIFVVVDPTDDKHLALERAIAGIPLRDPKPEVYVFIAVDSEVVDTRAVNDNLFRDQTWFEEEIRKPLEAIGVNYTIGISWSSEWQQSIVSEASRWGADNIFLPFHPRQNRMRFTFSESKWELFKSAHCPVLLARGGAKPRREVILAAVNFQATRDVQKQLNDNILTFGSKMAEVYGAELHVVNGYLDSMLYPDRGRLAKETGLPPERIHVRQGYTDEVVAAVSKELKADLVIIGTLGQTGMAKTRRGNTAERVITGLETDVVVVNHEQ